MNLLCILQSHREHWGALKTLTIVRHAKSSWDHPGLDDHDRPLNDRGKRDAPRIGEALKSRGVSPDLILSSTAKRAITTARIIAGEIGYDPGEIVQDENIYLAAPSTLMRIVNLIDENHQSAMIFGHNPGFHQLADGFVGGYGAVGQFPTCSVAMLQFDTESWGEIGIGDATLLDHFYPKSL